MKPETFIHFVPVHHNTVSLNKSFSKAIVLGAPSKNHIWAKATDSIGLTLFYSIRGSWGHIFLCRYYLKESLSPLFLCYPLSKTSKRLVLCPISYKRKKPKNNLQPTGFFLLFPLFWARFLQFFPELNNLKFLQSREWARHLFQ